jgi:hypothetical protein
MTAYKFNDRVKNIIHFGRRSSKFRDPRLQPAKSTGKSGIGSPPSGIGDLWLFRVYGLLAPCDLHQFAFQSFYYERAR